jgi:hypothetical protein
MASEDIDRDATNTNLAGSKEQQSSQDADLQHGPGKVDPALALELRLKWLEALILGMKQDLGKDRKGKAREEYTGIATAHLKPGETLTRLAETVQSKLDKAVEDNEGLKRFMDNCTPIPLFGLFHATFLLSLMYFNSLLTRSPHSRR